MLDGLLDSLVWLAGSALEGFLMDNGWEFLDWLTPDGTCAGSSDREPRTDDGGPSSPGPYAIGLALVLIGCVAAWFMLP